jgi:DNA-binding CsgD family transcriptional regulator/tetratricopeptide (TPR) repeat protein
MSPTTSPVPHDLLGREQALKGLDDVLESVRAGRSRVLVIRGEAGLGKTALLRYLAAAAADLNVIQAAGIESEMELPYGGLHQLCAPMLDQVDHLPAPQRDALKTVFGMSGGLTPDPFLVGLAVLTLFAEVAARQPLICIVDDGQWLDRASAQTLGFVGRRLLAERVALVCSARSGIGDEFLTGLPTLPVLALDASDARSLLLRHIHGPVDAAVCEQIVTESHGNPLALLELPRTWRGATLAGGFALPASTTRVAGRIEQSYLARLAQLPDATRLILLAAAAEPLGSVGLLQRAAESLGIEMTAVDAAIDAGLIQMHARVEFAHPLIRSAAYRIATTGDRQRVHGAFADVPEDELDLDRRAWHRARATPGIDEDVALELERSAGRAQERGGLAAAAAFLQRAVSLTQDPSQRGRRALAAAQANLQAGAFDAALTLLAAAEADPLDDLRRAQIDLLRGQVAFASGLGSDAPPLLLKAARRLEPLDPDLARETYLDAWIAALFAGQLAGEGNLADVSIAARAAPKASGTPHLHDVLLDAFTVVITEGPAAATPLLRRAERTLSNAGPISEELRWGWLGPAVANQLWDADSWHTILDRQVHLARSVGALARLSIDLNSLAVYLTWTGDFAAANSTIAELNGVTEVTGATIGPYATVLLAAFKGRETEASPLIRAMLEDVTSMGQGVGVTWARWSASVLFNGLGRYDDAFAEATRASEEMPNLYFSTWALPEVIEAAARTSNLKAAAPYLERLAETTRAAGTDWGLGVEARCRALLADGEAADALFREALERLGRTALSPELARTQLVYGEWLRRKGQRVDARAQLRAAHDTFVAIGMDAFSERSAHELLATGEKVRKRSDETRGDLTPQEEQIARLARDGLSNPEIGAMLFLSPRTVEWHLHKVFGKLQISSRGDLRTALPNIGLELKPVTS